MPNWVGQQQGVVVVWGGGGGGGEVGTLRQKRGAGGVRASTIALQERGCHDDGDQEGEGGGAQRDARSGRGGGVGRTAVGARGHGGGAVGAGGGVSPRCGFCAVLGDYLLEDKEEEEEEDAEECV